MSALAIPVLVKGLGKINGGGRGRKGEEGGGGGGLGRGGGGEEGGEGTRVAPSQKLDPYRKDE